MNLTTFSSSLQRGLSIASFFALAMFGTSRLASASVSTTASKGDILAWGDALVWEAEAKAVAAELERGRVGLRLDNSPAPYYLRMDWVRAQDWLINASYGGVTHHINQPSAIGRVSIRVGDHEHENRNF